MDSERKYSKGTWTLTMGISTILGIIAGLGILYICYKMYISWKRGDGVEMTSAQLDVRYGKNRNQRRGQDGL